MPKDLYEAISETTKAVYIDAYWDAVDARIDFLNQLYESGRQSEAMTLCAIYLDGVAGALAPPGTKVGIAFCRALSQHEPAPYFSLIHPLQLIFELRRVGKSWTQILQKLEKAFPGPSYMLMTESAFQQSTLALLTPTEYATLKPEVYRGSLASVAYNWIRNPAVHKLGGSNRIEFSSTTYNGAAVSSMGFAELMPTLRAMASAARANSHVKGVWP